jgi:hypothetical protein
MILKTFSALKAMMNLPDMRPSREIVVEHFDGFRAAESRRADRTFGFLQRQELDEV